MVVSSKGWFRLRNIIGLTVCTIVTYAIFQLWQNGLFQQRLQTYNSYYDDGVLKRPNVQKFAVVIQQDDRRLDELGGPDHWYHLLERLVWHVEAFQHTADTVMSTPHTGSTGIRNNGVSGVSGVNGVSGVSGGSGSTPSSRELYVIYEPSSGLHMSSPFSRLFFTAVVTGGNPRQLFDRVIFCQSKTGAMGQSGGHTDKDAPKDSSKGTSNDKGGNKDKGTNKSTNTDKSSKKGSKTGSDKEASKDQPRDVTEVHQIDPIFVLDYKDLDLDLTGGTGSTGSTGGTGGSDANADTGTSTGSSTGSGSASGSGSGTGSGSGSGSSRGGDAATSNRFIPWQTPHNASRPSPFTLPKGSYYDVGEYRGKIRVHVLHRISLSKTFPKHTWFDGKVQAFGLLREWVAGTCGLQVDREPLQER
jgi:hypothetical protein